MRTIYISGPYSGNVVQNVQRAVAVAEILTSRGYLVFLPHLTMLWDMLSPHDYEFWLEMDLEWVQKCDGLFRMKGDSQGADREVALALKLGIPTYFSLDQLPGAYENEQELHPAEIEVE